MRRGGGWCSEAALKACFQVGPQYTHAQVTSCKQTALGFSIELSEHLLECVRPEVYNSQAD